MELVAEAARFSVREAIKARQLARSIEDQEQCVKLPPHTPPTQLAVCPYHSALCDRYTRVREWVAEDTQAQETRAKNRRMAIAAIKQEAHRYVLVPLVFSFSGPKPFISVTRCTGSSLLASTCVRSRRERLKTRMGRSGTYASSVIILH
jgi:hypothetical protein